jgi:ribosomal protein S18 acetylase RimI-like enzyme
MGKAEILSAVTKSIVGKDGRVYKAVINLGKTAGQHDMTVYHNGKEVGNMAWNAVAEPGIPKGSVSMLDVNPAHQRNSIATQMWELANKASKEHGLVAPLHSTWQTPEGKAWATALDRIKKL